jgi:phosphoribosylglycinamide formyltransferase 1
MINLALFASGGGSNVEAILQQLPQICINEKIDLRKIIIFTNNPNAGVIGIAAKYGITAKVIDVSSKVTEVLLSNYTKLLERYAINFIVLAGFLKQIPGGLVALYPNRIINIHPALLPKYGGKGMYGIHVHEAVVNAKEKETGITIHYVDEHYDNGAHLLQVTCPVLPTDTAQDVAKKVLVLEHENYSRVIGDCLKKIGQ